MLQILFRHILSFYSRSQWYRNFRLLKWTFVLTKILHTLVLNTQINICDSLQCGFKNHWQTTLCPNFEIRSCNMMLVELMIVFLIIIAAAKQLNNYRWSISVLSWHSTRYHRFVTLRYLRGYRIWYDKCV